MTSWDSRGTISGPTMRIPTPACPICGSMEYVDVTRQQLIELVSPNRQHIQDILPNFSADVRERFVTGICPTCWNKMMPPEVEELEELEEE